MYRTFKEKAVFKAASVSKKHKALKPFAFLTLGIVLGAYDILLYFKNNNKRFVTMGLCFMFFIMSSSFATPEQSADNEIYLRESDVKEEIEADTIASDEAVAEVPDISDVDFIDYEDDSEIVSTEILPESLGKQLANTDNIDKFTSSDFKKNESQASDRESGSDESSFDKDAWNLLLVNKTHPIPDDYEVPLTTIKGNMQCDERVLEPLCEMLDAAAKDGIDLMVVSPYRDYELQKVLFERRINQYMANGLSYMDAYKYASQKVIVPGASEHQLGIAFDIVTGSHTTLDYEFGDTPAGRWLKEHGREYGFILRYPRDKIYITGIEYEPWHYRYVGVDAATYIMDNDLTLEEFIESLE